MPDDPPFNLAARLSQHRAMAQAYRARAEVTADELLHRVFSGLATTYENMARAIELTGARIDAIEQATARARSKIKPREPDRADGPEPGSA